jgi:hypothetical protein
MNLNLGAKKSDVWGGQRFEVGEAKQFLVSFQISKESFLSF